MMQIISLYPVAHPARQPDNLAFLNGRCPGRLPILKGLGEYWIHFLLLAALVIVYVKFTMEEWGWHP